MSEEIKMNDVMSAVNALRDSAEKGGVNSPEFKELEAKTESILEAQEKQSQEAVAKIAESEKKSAELQEQFNDLQVEMARSASAKNINHKDTDEYKALNMLIKSGERGINDEQKSLLRSDNDVSGGYLTVSEMDTSIIKAITEVSPVRQYAKVRTVGKKTLEMPSRQTRLIASYEGEAEQDEKSGSTYGTETLTAYRTSVTAEYTMDLLLDSNFDIESEISGDVAEAFAEVEGRLFVTGDGDKKPEGFLSHADIVSGAFDGAAGGKLVADDLIKLTGELKTGYNGMYAFNRRTLAQIRVTKGSSNDHYLWSEGFGASNPNTIMGDAYIVMNDMPDVAVGALPVVYADFAKGYTIIDRTGMTLIRDELTGKRKNIIELTFHRYNSGMVTLPEAFKALKITA